MGIIKLAIAQLKAKPFNSLLSIILFALGMGIISLLLHFEQFTQKQIRGNLAGIDLVVGAKGSPLQLILSSVLHADNPTGNISLEEADRISENPLVKNTIPLAMGDNYKGFRIVGTSRDYAQLYKAQIAKGQWNQKVMEVTLGATVAHKAGLKINDTFASVHGFREEGHRHEDQKYKVTGILEPTGTVVDRLLLTNVNSVWQIHHHHHEEEEHSSAENMGEHSKMDLILHKVAHHEALTAAEANLYNQYKGTPEHVENEEKKEITALLVFYRSPMAATTLPRMINQNTPMQAASPALELNRFMSLLGYGLDALKVLAWVIILFSAINIMIHLLNKLNQEIYEIALMRSLGIHRLKIMTLMLLQGIILSALGWLFGVIFTHITLFIVSGLIGQIGFSPTATLSTSELVMLLYALAIGTVSALIPAIRAYKSDIHFLLNKV